MSSLLDTEQQPKEAQKKVPTDEERGDTQIFYKGLTPFDAARQLRLETEILGLTKQEEKALKKKMAVKGAKRKKKKRSKRNPKQLTPEQLEHKMDKEYLKYIGTQVKWVVFASMLLSSFEVLVFCIAFLSMDACQTYGMFKYGDNWLGDTILGFQWACND